MAVFLARLLVARRPARARLVFRRTAFQVGVVGKHAGDVAVQFPVAMIGVQMNAHLPVVWRGRH
jgi:hypothetical protein